MQSSFEALGTVSALMSGSNSLCLIFNYQTQFKPGVKRDFVIVGLKFAGGPRQVKIRR